MFVFQRFQLSALLAICLAATVATGCSEPTPDNATTPPPAQTSDEIEQDLTEQERLEAAAEKAEQEKERRVERNRNAVSDLMFIGMTLAEANEALGVPGVKGLSIGSGEEEHENFEWKLEGNITIKATFINGKLDQKEMVE